MMVEPAKKAARAALGKSATKRWTIGGEDLAELARIAFIAAAIALASHFTGHENSTVAALALVAADALRRWAADDN